MIPVKRIVGFAAAAVVITVAVFFSKREAPEPIRVKEETDLPEKVEWMVPFTAQAPLGNWGNVKQGNGCEEASVLMAYAWVKGKDIDPNSAAEEIEKISDF